MNTTRTAEDKPQPPEPKDVDDMTAAFVLEAESGTWTGEIHPHNGYYAGDFSDVPPLTQSQLDDLMTVCRDVTQRRNLK